MDSLGNDEQLEMLWATKAFDHAEVYFNIICSCDPKYLKLTAIDDTIYQYFRNSFPNFNVERVNEDEMKNTSGKIKWREFCELFKTAVEDYSFGTLLRVNCTGGNTPENVIFVTRIQFLAIEIARNREGFNDGLRDAQPIQEKNGD